MSVFSLGAQVPCQGGDADDDAHEDGGVCFPVCRLCVPATGGRPDVLRVPVPVLGHRLHVAMRWHARNGISSAYGTRGPPP